MSDKIKREWIVWVANHFPEVIRIPKYCSAPDCENIPIHVCVDKYNYFLCDSCANLVAFEKRYAAYEGKNKMSTNFYHRYNCCEYCDRYDKRHIGKSSAGWQFSFRAYYDDDGNIIIGSYNDWKEVLKSGDIFDEYGTWYRYDQFFERVDSSKGKRNHYDYIKNAPQYQEYGMKHLEGNYKDEDGWDFSKGEFS